MPDHAAEIAENTVGAAGPVRLSHGLVVSFLAGGAILDVGFGCHASVVAQARQVTFDPGTEAAPLAVADASQDAVFAGDCLARIHDFRAALRDWFRVLKPGGFLVLALPHHHLHEKRLTLPSRWQPDRKRFYTPGLLLLDLESALAPNSYRLRHLADNDAGFDYAAPRDTPPSGGDAIELVIEKITPPAWTLATTPPARVVSNPVAVPVARPVLPAARHADAREVAPGMQDRGGMLVRDFAPPHSRGDRICVLKLDHVGDFVMALPALNALRCAFPDHHIRLVCGSWNIATAKASGLVDEVRSYDYFPEYAGTWNGQPLQGQDAFAVACEGAFDIAIDLRIDEDTRHLLAGIDAALRCGIGARERFPFLDIALPLGHHGRFNGGAATQPETVLLPERFNSRMERRNALAHETRFRGRAEAVIDGPGITLPVGAFRATFGVSVPGFVPGPRGSSVTVEVVCNDHVVAARAFGRASIRGLAEQPPALDFTNADPNARHDFRIRASGTPLAGRLRFTGTRLEHLAAPSPPRMRAVELHVGEQIGLLVDLIRQRTIDLSRFARNGLAGSNADHTAEFAPMPAGMRRIVIAPASNSSLRDWPIDKYVALVGRFLGELDCRVVLIGSRLQVAQADHIVERNHGDRRIMNLAGRTSWADIPRVLAAADLVVCNNSGIAHQAAALGVRTLAIHSGSHQAQEWGPRGPAARAVMAPVPCSPCGLERIEDCPNQHLCMELITPGYVFETALQMLETGSDPTREITAPATAVAPSASAP